MASSSSSSKSSQPLHNFELPPLLKWHSKDGKSAGTQKRYRTVKSAAAASPPPADLPMFHLVAAAALFEADLMPPPPPREPAGGEAKEAAALDDEFERMSLLRDESLRNYRGRDWRSEADRSPVISYRRKSAPKNRHSSGKTSISPSPASAVAGEDSRRKSPLNKPAFAAPPAPTVRLLNYFDSENRGKSENPAAVEFDSYRKSISDSYSDAFSFKKSEFSSSPSSSAWKKHDWFNKSSPAEDADSFQKIPYYKKFEFVSKSKPDFPSNSEISVKIEAAEEADASNPKQSKKDANPNDNSKIEKQSKKDAKSDDKMKSKVVEDSHLPPKKKPSFALASPDASPKIPMLKPKIEQSDAAEKKSKPAASDAAKIKIEPKEVKQEVENPKKDTDLTGDDAEATRVWNLRPRIPKGKGKGKAVAQPQKKSGGASKSAVEKMKKLSISVSLTKEEIEEDIFALTGAKPARRPKRRPRNVQRQLDAVFPGLWLVSISKDTYKVSEKK